METQRYKHDTQHLTSNMQINMNIQPHTHFTDTQLQSSQILAYLECPGVV